MSCHKFDNITMSKLQNGGCNGNNNNTSGQAKRDEAEMSKSCLTSVDY